MSQTLKEAPLTTRNARAKLDLGLYWRGVDPDIHLGYRKGKRGGRWLVRWYEGKGVYRQHAIGTADDALDGDGTHTYSFSQALTAARPLAQAALQLARCRRSRSKKPLKTTSPCGSGERNSLKDRAACAGIIDLG